MGGAWNRTNEWSFTAIKTHVIWNESIQPIIKPLLIIDNVLVFLLSQLFLVGCRACRSVVETNGKDYGCICSIQLSLCCENLIRGRARDEACCLILLGWWLVANEPASVPNLYKPTRVSTINPFMILCILWLGLGSFQFTWLSLKLFGRVLNNPSLTTIMLDNWNAYAQIATWAKRMSYFEELLSSDPNATLAVLVERVHRQTPTSHHFNHICMGSMTLSIERLHEML